MTKNTELEHRILELVLHGNYQPLKPKAIAKKLRLQDREREVKQCIKRLIKKGQLMYGPKHLVMNPTVVADKKKRKSKTKSVKGNLKSNEVVGVFRRNPGGYGFVTPLDSVATDRSDDIFVPRSKTVDASDRDTVKVRVSRRSGPGNRKSGRIVEVIQRYTHRFVGTYSESNGLGIVTVDGGLFETAILVGDAGAKNGRVGDKVVIEIANFPSEHQPGEGVIVDVLGERGQPGVDTQSIIHQYGLPQEFPESVLQNARDQADNFEEEDIEGRTDFRNKTVITIDPKTARDFDDAISLERLENGHWELGVHIADVSHFVPYRSDLDNEAFARGTSVYLPDKVIPMLPEIISNNLASLQPHRTRYCMTAIIEFTEQGVPVQTELHRGAIQSQHRFNYEEIDDYLENDRPWKKKLKPEVFRLVRDMHTLAMILRERRMTGGAINLILPEVKIDLDENGKMAGAHTVDHTESHQVIEEFMLAANEAVARYLDDEELFFMRRIHATPTDKKVADLTSFVQGLGVQCSSLRDRFEVKRVVEESEGTPEAHAIHFAVLRSMQKAVYGPEEIGHYALNSDYYCHFTSPIRRYPDLIIHRMVGDLIDGKRPDSNFDRLAMLGKHCSDLEKRATDAERDLIKLKLLNFLVDRVGKKMEAVVTGVEAFGLFAQGIDIPAEGLVPIESLPMDAYRFTKETRTLSGHKANHEFRLGDLIQVQVAVVDPDQRILEFDFAGRSKYRQKSTASTPKPKPSSSRSRKTRSKKSATQEKSKPASKVRASKSDKKQKSKSDSKKRSTKKPAKSNKATRKKKNDPQRKSKKKSQSPRSGKKKSSPQKKSSPKRKGSKKR